MIYINIQIFIQTEEMYNEMKYINQREINNDNTFYSNKSNLYLFIIIFESSYNIKFSFISI